MKIIKYTKMLFLFILIAMNISCDQITKNEVRDRVQENEVIKVIDSNVILTNVENTGAAMSIGSDLSPVMKSIFLQILPLLVMLGLIVFLIRSTELPKIHQIALASIIGGGIGNLIDRIKFNSVTDFMLIEIGPLKTGVFNMADVSIMIGALLILFSTFVNNKAQKVKHSLEK